MSGIAFQDQMGPNKCFGCGPDNAEGLKIKSFWEGPDEAVCRHRAKPHHLAGPEGILNGGVIGVLIDCHSICTAIAHAYRSEARAINSDPRLWYVTGKMSINYLKPADVNDDVVLRAKVIEAGPKKSLVHCDLLSHDQICATGEVIAIRVPLTWLDTHHRA